jgi:ribosomal-protein-alanine N-acetyltransferase
VIAVAPLTETDVQNTGIQIVPMRRRHLRAVLRIEDQQAQQGWSLGLFLAELRRTEGRAYLVARAGTDVVGFAGLLMVAGDAHVTNIAVDDSWRRHGIGSRLMLALAQRALDDGCTNLTLEVRAGNEAAIALYRRFGMAPAGIRKNYYADIGEDALIMWAHDIDAPAYRERLAAIAARLGGAATVEGFDA